MLFSATFGTKVAQKSTYLKPLLPPVLQALLLAQCTLVRKGSSADALKPWEASAYADAVEQQQRSQVSASLGGLHVVCWENWTEACASLALWGSQL